jgi:carboxyl-terminal processing protease
MENKKMFIFGLVSGIVAMLFIVLIVLSINLFGGNNVKIDGVADDETESVSMEEFEDKIDVLEDVIDAYYYEDYDETVLYETAYEGYVSGLGDPYTSYYTADEYKSLLEATSGSYEGIGVVISYAENNEDIIVVAPFEGSPGQEAGMLPGDIILQVEDLVVKGMTLEEVASNMKGEKGTSVTIKIYRESTLETFDIVVERDVIDMTTVSHEMLEGDIGYISISGFQEVTYEQFMEAYNELEDQGQKGMIIDLRDNPGGLVTVVDEIADELLPEGLIVYTEDKYGNRQSLYSDAKRSFDKPLVILVNENSASASEILSGAVKDHGVGTIVGTTTFGKGLVQSLVPLDDGSAVKVTISKYYTPAGNYIHGVGIEPDIYVEIPEEYQSQLYIEREEDTQFQKAVEVIAEMIEE